ncbi:WD-40 repeat-containing protein MSI4-like [Carex rostrata]
MGPIFYTLSLSLPMRALRKRKRLRETERDDRERGKGLNAALRKDEEYQNWKSNVPVIYDWFTGHKLVWPSLSCRWGGQFVKDRYKSRQRLYLAEQERTSQIYTDGSLPNTLMITNCDILKPKVATAADISQFNEEAQSPFVKRYKTLVHPGEVSIIRELPQNNNIVATHTDSPDVFIWDLKAQPNRHPVERAAYSRPDAILTGHRENAVFALAMCPTEPFVLSGGKDKSVVLWSIQDTITSLGLSESRRSPNYLAPRGVFKGHDAIVKDVQFCPSSAQEFCSISDDSFLILWDARSGNAPVVKVEKTHGARELHCVDWNAQNMNLILTGSGDNTVCLFDRRFLTTGGEALPIYMFEGHKAPVTSIQWCLDRASVFASAGEDGILNIWDYYKSENERAKTNPGLFFQHSGHRDAIMDFHWNPAEPWTLVSITVDISSTIGGSTLQIWRMSDMLYRPEEDVLRELDHYKELLKICDPPAKSKKKI